MVRLPVAVFILTFRKSIPLSWSGCILSMIPAVRHTYTSAFGRHILCVHGTIGILPVKPCRQRRHFSPQMRVNRFVFLNLPIVSLGDHLGVTVSPQSPFPTGYVTLPACSRSPPFRLMPYHSIEQDTRNSSFLIVFQTYAPRLSPGRGASYVMSAHQTWFACLIGSFRNR